MVRPVTFQAETRTGAGPASRLALNVLGAPARGQGVVLREDSVRALLRTAADGGVGLVATRPVSDVERLGSGDAGEKRDWDRFHSLFHPGARLIPSGPRRTGGGHAANVITPAQYVERSGAMLERDGFHEE